MAPFFSNENFALLVFASARIACDDSVDCAETNALWLASTVIASVMPIDIKFLDEYMTAHYCRWPTRVNIERTPRNSTTVCDERGEFSQNAEAVLSESADAPTI